MLIAVTGSSGFDVDASAGTDAITGLPTAASTALLAAAGPSSGRHTIVLCPPEAEPWARRQAHVLVAAAPTARVAVLALDHHPLTLTLIAAAAVAEAGPAADPGLVVATIRRSAARSRSLVWYPRAIGLRDTVVTSKQRLSSLFGAPGFFRELGSDTSLLPARAGSPVAAGDEVYVPGEAPAQLHQQLGTTVRSVPITIEPQPWTARGAVPIAVLVGARAPLTDRECPLCGVLLAEDGCAFCGTRRSRSAPAPVGATTSTGEVAE